MLPDTWLGWAVFLCAAAGAWFLITLFLCALVAGVAWWNSYQRVRAQEKALRELGRWKARQAEGDPEQDLAFTADRPGRVQFPGEAI